MASFTRQVSETEQEPIEVSKGSVQELKYFDHKRGGQFSHRGSVLKLKSADGKRFEIVRLAEDAGEVSKILGVPITGWKPPAPEAAAAASVAPSLPSAASNATSAPASS